MPGFLRTGGAWHLSPLPIYPEHVVASSPVRLSHLDFESCSCVARPLGALFPLWQPWASFFCPADHHSASYWVYFQGTVTPKADLQDLGATPAELAILRVRMHEAADPIRPLEDPSLAGPDLTPPLCPACRGRHRPHTKVIGECGNATRPSGYDLLPPPILKMHNTADKTTEEKYLQESGYEHKFAISLAPPFTSRARSTSLCSAR